jgi:hypothetical protein
MRTLKLFLILSVMFMALPARAADAKASASDEARPENVEPKIDKSSSDPAERPKREAVKMSPTIRVSPSRPDEAKKMRQMAPARTDLPLLNMPAPKDMSPPQGGETPGSR